MNTKIILALVFSTLAFDAMSQSMNQNSAQTANSGSFSASDSNSGSMSYNNQDFSNHSVNRAPDLSSAVGIATAPALTTTLTETCMGSTSFGAGFSGGSFSFGTTWRDTACVRRLDARQIQSMGDVQAAKEIMCDSDLVRGAFKRVGRPCAQDGGSYAPAVKPVAMVEPVVVAPSDAEQNVTDEQDLQDRAAAARRF